MDRHKSIQAIVGMRFTAAPKAPLPRSQPVVRPLPNNVIKPSTPATTALEQATRSKIQDAYDYHESHEKILSAKDIPDIDGPIEGFDEMEAEEALAGEDKMDEPEIVMTHHGSIHGTTDDRFAHL